MRLGDECLEKEDCQGAFGYYTQVLRLKLNNEDAYFYRGKARYELGDKQGAIDDYNQAIKFNPNYALAYAGRGFTRNELGDKQGAIEDYNQAIKFNPNYALAYYNRGFVRKRMFEKWYSVIFITLLPPLVPPCKGLVGGAGNKRDLKGRLGRRADSPREFTLSTLM
ncbi:MAG: tetratricopeptide repeat protein [Aphanizomenon flos-aquae KM1D3_PB]|nr:MAG: tetratricopeptide repeat protein [Aphanizomenon flos-aquae KM1D3_PB]